MLPNLTAAYCVPAETIFLQITQLYVYVLGINIIIALALYYYIFIKKEYQIDYIKILIGVLIAFNFVPLFELLITWLITI